MKFKIAIVGILSAILTLNAVGITVIISETKKQTELAQKTAELAYIQTETIIYTVATDEIKNNNTANDTNVSNFNRIMRSLDQANKIGKFINEELYLSILDNERPVE